MTFPWQDSNRYNSFANYNRKRFGGRVQKISVNAGFTCPNRDGTVAWGGCTYCNNDSFSPNHLDPSENIRLQVNEGLTFMRKRYKARHYIVYFQAYSNTYAPLSHLKKLYEPALEPDDIIGLTIGTRTDCVDREKLAYLNDLGESNYITLEYGLESMHDDTLLRINRGHDYQSWQDTVALTQTYENLHICAHIIFGLPGESREMMLQMADAINASGSNYHKMNLLNIVKKTALAAEYKKNPFPLFSYADYIPFIADFLERLNPNIVIQRLFGEAHPRILVAPHWQVSASEVVKDINSELSRRDSWQGKLFHEN
jgi:radical SAM protein (TIGR01212 family)